MNKSCAANKKMQIIMTLDKKEKHRGLLFKNLGIHFSGQRFKVYKTLERIVLESTGSLRRMSTPIVIHEGLFCDGRALGNCGKSGLWSEDWLRLVSGPDSEV